MNRLNGSTTSLLSSGRGLRGDRWYTALHSLRRSAARMTSALMVPQQQLQRQVQRRAARQRRFAAAHERRCDRRPSNNRLQSRPPVAMDCSCAERVTGNGVDVEAGGTTYVLAE